MATARAKPRESHGPRYRKVFPLFWDDVGVQRLDDAGKVIALYCLTSRQANRIGIFRFSLGTASEDLGYGGNVSATFRQRFLKVVHTLNWRWDEASRVLYMPSWWKWNHPENPNTLIGNLGDVADLPETALFYEFANNTEHLKANVTVTFMETLAKRYPQRMANQEQEQEQEQEQKQEQEQDAYCPDLQGEIVLTFPRTKKRIWHLTETKLTEYQQSYPGIDALAECRAALQWLRDNPSRIKSDVQRYLGGWLQRAQDRKGGRDCFASSQQTKTFDFDPAAIYGDSR